ncbi:putative MFS family arabinose efflux permease [Bradyrhizobium sp. USDA 4354]
MQKSEARPHDHGLPPALYVISGASFAAALSARALDPVLPHVAEDFGVSIATAAGFAAVFAFTFSIIQPIIGAAADLFGKTRLMIGCLALLGLANILGALSSSFSLLFVTRILAGIGSGGVFPVALSLTSDLVGPEKRQVAIGRTLAGAMTGNLLGASASGLIGDFLGWRGVLAVLGALVIVASIAVAAGFHGAKVKHPPRIRTPSSATRPYSSKAAACSACFPTSPRSCSSSGRLRCRSPASSSPALRWVGCSTR